MCSSVLEDIASSMQKDALAALGAVLEHNEQFSRKHVLPKGVRGGCKCCISERYMWECRFSGLSLI